MIDKDNFAHYVNNLWHKHETGTIEKDLAVVSLGLAGETGEVVELLKKHIRDGKININDLRLELGDLLHYLIRVADHYQLSLEEIMQAHISKMEGKYGLLYNPAPEESGRSPVRR